jgi:hypothetical protein
VIKASDFNLSKGIEKLKELAGLSVISDSVPVTFYITLNAAK